MEENKGTNGFSRNEQSLLKNETYSPLNEVDGSKVTNGSEDFIDTEPQDANNRKSVLTSVAGYIIVTEFCERLAYYGFAGSLVLFLQREFNYSNSDADVQYSLFYWAINLGSLIAYTLVSYICQYGVPDLGGEEWGFF
eukprot:gene35387-45847_t